jgi:amidohydrolase
VPDSSSRIGGLMQAARLIESDLIALRRTLHAEPEVGFKEFKTSKRLRDVCVAAGATPSESIAETGFYVDLGPKSGPIIAYRTDIDALPIQDFKTVGYCSTTPGYGHLCGHDVHSTIATGIVRLLKPLEASLNKRVRVFFQPAEETSPSGAPLILQAGVLDQAELVMGMHCDPTLPSGQMGLKPGADTASFDGFDITVKSPFTLHSARPHTGPDAMWIALKLASELYALPTRITDSQVPSVIAVGTFHGGEAINAIPDTVRFTGTIRTSGQHERDILNDHLEKLLKAYEALYGVSVTRTRHEGAPPVMNDPQLTQRIGGKLASLMGATNVVPRHQSMGAEDFGHYTAKMPGVFIRVGSQKNSDTAHELHSNYFDVDESIIAPTCAYFADTLIALANSEI